jgi:hypothetical protein
MPAKEDSMISEGSTTILAEVWCFRSDKIEHISAIIDILSVRDH